MRKFSLLLLCSTLASASPLLVTESGVWGAGAPITTWSAPDESWSYSFLTDSNPAVSEVNLGEDFQGAFSDFTYTLNGAPVTTTPTDITWFSATDGGLIDVDFATASFVLEGDQAYSGMESAPTILPGIYALNDNSYFGPEGDTIQPLTGNLSITAVSPTATPEPATIGFLLAASGLMVAVRLRKRV